MLTMLPACQDEIKLQPYPGPVPEGYSKTHTTLLYMIADNSLSNFIAQDMRESCQGYLQASGSMNLQIYMDNYSNNSGMPMLLNVRRTEKRDSLIYDTLHTWNPDHNSADPAIMASIIKEAFSGKFDTPVKGIVFSSHGYGWTPAVSYHAAGSRSMNSSTTPEPQWFGQDNTPTTNFMEIWDLREALKQSGVSLSHIMFDACFMSNAETAYELRDCARYLISSVCEIPGDGYDYTRVIPELSKITSLSNVPDALKKVVDCYGIEYNDQCKAAAELCLTDLSYMDEIAAAYKKLRVGKTLDPNMIVSMDSLSTSGKPLARIQSYGRFFVGSYYDYFDIVDCARLYGDDGSFAELLKKAVIHEFHASMFRAVPAYDAAGDRRKGSSDESFPFSSCSGMSVSLTEMFDYSERYNRLSDHPTANQMRSAYGRSQWGMNLMTE